MPTLDPRPAALEDLLAKLPPCLPLAALCAKRIAEGMTKFGDAWLTEDLVHELRQECADGPNYASMITVKHPSPEVSAICHAIALHMLEAYKLTALLEDAVAEVEAQKQEDAQE